MTERSMIERVARAISNVQLWSRYNDWTSDRVDGYPVEICRYGLLNEDEIVVVRRFPASADETEALTTTVREARAHAAIEAMRLPTPDMVQHAKADVCVWSGDELREDFREDVYTAMIDAALKEKADA